MEFMVSSTLPAPWLLYAGAVLDFGFAAVSVGCLSENHEDMLLRNPFDSSFFCATVETLGRIFTLSSGSAGLASFACEGVS